MGLRVVRLDGGCRGKRTFRRGLGDGLGWGDGRGGCRRRLDDLGKGLVWRTVRWKGKIELEVLEW